MINLCSGKSTKLREITMKQALFIEAQYEDDVMVIRPMGTFNCWQLPTINAIIGTYLNSVQTPQIVINLNHVRFVDTPTFVQLYSLLEKARLCGGDIKLCELSFKVRTVLNTQVLNATFDVYESESSAVVAFDEIIFSIRSA